MANREIKFRVFSKEAKTMWNINKLMHLQFTGNGDWQVFDKVIGCIFMTNDSGYIMQYTGLNDKNGKEIYEGDVVKHKKAYNTGNQRDEEGNGVVMFDNGCFILEYYRPPDYKYTEHCRFDEYDKVEIIGNRFENPELLKEKENER